MKKAWIVIMLLGVVLLAVGMYYLFIKAGIPYQDPTPELAEQYARDSEIGMISSLAGIVTGIIGGIGVIVTSIRKRK